MPPYWMFSAARVLWGWRRFRAVHRFATLLVGGAKIPDPEFAEIEKAIGRDGIAGLLEPFADGGLGDGFTESGNADLSHDVFPDLSTP